jgi:DNA polymerase elongation subunit (family B)
LDTVDSIVNKDLIDFEYTGVSIPKKDLESEAKQINLPSNSTSEEILLAKKCIQYTTDKAKVVVEFYKTEAEVLLAWQRLITTEDPDLLIGYNIMQFDYKFLYDRAKQLGILSQFTQLSRHHGHEGELKKQEMSSAGMGENILYYIDIPGRVSIDLYKVAQRMFQLENYKLDFICGKFLNKSKVDIEPKEIFIKQRGNSYDRTLVAQYCIIDCILCIRLLDKLDIIINNVGMSQVCSVPFSYLFLRGQGIKLLSLMAKKCREGGFLLPYIEPEENPDGYEGAIVLDPIKDIHYDAISVADFNSLYPSCMISENLSHEMFIGSIQVKLDESTDFRGKPITNSLYEANLLAGKYEGWDYLDITYDIKKIVVNPNPRRGQKKKKEITIGRNICRFVQPPNGVKGVVPQILQKKFEINILRVHLNTTSMKVYS